MPIDWTWYLPTSLSGRAALTGAAAANLAAPFAAAIIASVYRFPIPLVGYSYGISGALSAAFASLFYLFLGGAVVLGVLGAASGLVATHIAAPDSGRVLYLTLTFAAACALLCATALATLELFIGAW